MVRDVPAPTKHRYHRAHTDSTSPDSASSGRTPSGDSSIDVDAYLSRIGIEPGTVTDPDLETLARIQRAHVTTVPFENLAIVGAPPSADGDAKSGEHSAPGPGVELSIPALAEKIVNQERGGYCFDLNGLFATLLASLGFDVDRVAARVSGGLTVPANHHSIVVTLDQRYVVDVGTGTPMIRRPLPMDGTLVEDEIGVEWRVGDCTRPDDDHLVEYREPDSDKWSSRYVFSHVPRDLSYFHATNDYLQSAPESSFTSDPIVQIATPDGHRKLTADTILDPLDETTAQPVEPTDWHDVLETEFGIRLDSG